MKARAGHFYQVLIYVVLEKSRVVIYGGIYWTDLITMSLLL